MSEIEIAAESVDDALKTIQEQYGLPREALEVLETSDSGDTLEGVKPLEVNVKLRINLDYLHDQALRRISELLELMEIKASVEGQIKGNIIYIGIDSEKSSLIIGKQGQNLEALQYLINRMICRGGRGMPLVLLDVQNYHQKYHSRIMRIAQDSAESALRTKKKVELDPMFPEERKIVHNVVKSYKGLATYSSGAEGKRHVVITPTE